MGVVKQSFSYKVYYKFVDYSTEAITMKDMISGLYLCLMLPSMITAINVKSYGKSSFNLDGSGEKIEIPVNILLNWLL